MIQQEYTVCPKDNQPLCTLEMARYKVKEKGVVKVWKGTDDHILMELSVFILLSMYPYNFLLFIPLLYETFDGSSILTLPKELHWKKFYNNSFIKLFVMKLWFYWCLCQHMVLVLLNEKSVTVSTNVSHYFWRFVKKKFRSRGSSHKEILLLSTVSLL